MSTEQIMTYVVAFLSSGVGATVITVIVKSIVNAICTYKTKKVSRLTDGDKKEISKMVVTDVLTAIQGGVNIDVEAMIDKATNKRLTAIETQFNDIAGQMNKLSDIVVAEGQVLSEFKTPSLGSRELLNAVLSDSLKKLSALPLLEQAKLVVSQKGEQKEEQPVVTEEPQKLMY